MGSRDYQPVYTPGHALTLTLSAACLAGELLEVSGSDTVAPVLGDASLKVIGIAAFSTPLGERVTVHARGPIHELPAQGTITAGDLVVASAAVGRAVRTKVSGDDPSSVLGVALISVTDGALARWMQT
jgi:hypothetical protein